MSKKKLDEIYGATCPKCGGLHITASGMPDFDIEAEIKKLIDAYYNGYDGKITASTLANKVATTISAAVADGYSKKIFDVAWNSPDWEQIKNLQHNVYQFSFAKCHEQLKATTQALYDDEGRIIPYKEFEQIATRINSEYNVRHLPTEYNTAIASAQMSSRWVQFQAEKKDLPNLTYRTVGDENVRQSHRLLDGVTRPVDDIVWDTIFTPNGWGCRCDIEQSTGGAVTPKDKIIYPTDIPPMFKTNLAKSGLVFPKDHPYYDKLPKSVVQAADNNNPWKYDKIHPGKKGGYVYSNPLHSKTRGWVDELHIAKVLSDLGEKVVFLPEINPQNKWKNTLRKLVLPKGVKDGKNADALLNGKQVADFKTSTANTSTSIKDLIKSGGKQADLVCLKLTAKVTPQTLKRALKGQVLKSEDVKEVWILDVNDKLQKYSRKDIAEFFKSKKQK